MHLKCNLTYLHGNPSMKHLITSNIRFLILTLFFILHISFANPKTQALTFDLDNFSYEDLNYETCKIYRQRSRNRDPRYSLKSLELSPESVGGSLINKMCDFAPFYSGTPRQLLNRKHYNYSSRENKYIPKAGFKELDFTAEAEAFLKTSKTNLPNCDKSKPKHICFGSGLVWNGFYLGEWSNEKPNGQGIQLLTRGAPYGFDKTVWNSIFRGAFKDGMFHGNGKYFNLTQSFEGNWYRGEMHGRIDWQWPVIYDFGFSFIRYESEIVVSEISAFGPAESAGLQVGDIIATITNGNEIIQTDKVGIKSIDRFLNKVDTNGEISIQILNKDLNSYRSITFSKTSKNQKDRTAMFCIASRDEKCYEKSILKNIFIDAGKESRGSYNMGMRHAFTADDLHVYKQDDSSVLVNMYCFGSPPPMAVITKNKSLLDKIKFVTPSVFILDTGYNAPCLWAKGFPWSVNKFSFPHLLKENQEALDLLSDLSGLYKFDISDYLDDFISQLDRGLSPDDIKSIAHDWCNYDLLYHYCGRGRHDSSYVIRRQIKIVDNPESAAFKRKRQMQIKRAEENYLIASSCISSSADAGDNSTGRSLAKTCINNLVARRISFWNCVYRGKSMANCSYITNSKTPISVAAFKFANPDALDEVDLNSWIFGDL